MSTLYGRKYEAIIGNTKFTNDDFTIHFDIPFDDGAEPNIAEIQIYNLKDTTINNIKDGQSVIFNAGYQKDVGAVLLGTVRRPFTEYRGVDRVTTIYVLDANDKWMEKWVEKTYKERITGLQVLNDLISMSGLKIGSMSVPTNVIYTGAKTVKNMLGKAIVEVTKDCGAKIHVNRGKIFIREKAKGDNIGFILDRDHGLVGSPTPIESEYEVGIDENKRKIKRKGFKVLSLLHHRITTDSVLQLKSETANGLFRVEAGKHYSSGSSYYTEMEVYPV